MRQSRSIQKTRNTSSTPQKQIKKNNSSESDYYYCHFKNAMYMGGIKAFQKHGRGIMIYDDGVSAVTSYFNDFKNGHNIYYRQNCIMSVDYQKNKVHQIVLRTSYYLVMLRYGKDQKPEGRCLLVDYSTNSIYYVVYKKGAIVQKRQQQDSAVINRIFDLENLQYLIGETHANAVKFQIQRDQNIASQKSSNKFQAGFYKKGLLNGLGFILMVKNPELSISDSTQNTQTFVQVVQRGYFVNSQLHGMGYKRFKNGNHYVGDFKNGLFEGNGILKNDMKKNWVYGAFQSGNMCDLLQYSTEGQQIRKFEKLVLSLHQRKNNWINNEIDAPLPGQYIKEIQKILKNNPTEQMKNLTQKKQEVLKKIQDNFLYDQYNTNLAESEESNNFNQENQPQNSNRNTSVNFNSKSMFSNKQGKQGNFQLKLKPVNATKYDTNEMGSQTVPTRSSRFKTDVDPSTAKGSSARLRSVSSKQQPLGTIPQQPLKNSNLRERSKSPVVKKQDELSFALDSKRIIGKSRIFKQYSSQEQELPKFNYTPT